MRNFITAAGSLLCLVGSLTLPGPVFADPERSGVAGKPVAIRGSRDFRAESGSEAIVPISIEAGAVVIEASINGGEPLPLILDFGAQDALTPETVATLGLQASGTGVVEDSGGHSAPTSFTKVGSVRLADAQITDLRFLVLPLPQYLTDRGNQTPIAGLIGCELLARFVVRLDYDNRTLTLRPGSDFRHPETEVAAPLLSRDGMPAVPAAADGIPGVFVIDTGSTGALTLGRRFVEDHRIETHHPSVLRIKSVGASGSFETILTRIDSFEVAGSRIDRPATRFPTLGGNGLRSTDIDGTMGYEILRQFVITLDYGQGKVWFERSRAFGLRTGQGGAGFQAVRTGGAGFRVVTVVPDTAARLSGLEVGDLIIEVDGRSTISMSLDEMAELMRRPVGTLVHLGTIRNGKFRPIALTLKDVLP
jgi:hypothetical protein